MSEKRGLPAGWVLCSVLDLAQLVRGVTYSKPDAVKEPRVGYWPLLRANNINGKVNHDDLVYVREKCISQEQWLGKGDVLIAMSSGSQHLVGKAAQVREDISETFGAFCGALRPSLELDATFFGWFFQTRRYRESVAADAKGSNINNLKRDHILRVPFALPPLNEQRRIVEKIETLFARLDQGEAALRRTQTLLARYRQSVLKAAVTGALTADWRAENAHRMEHGRDLLARILQTRRETWQGRGKYKGPAAPDTTGLPELPEGWVWATVEQVARVIGGLTKNSKRLEMPLRMPMLRVANVYQNRLDLSDVHETGVTATECERASLEDFDLLVVEGNGSKDQIGRMAIWRNEIPGAVHQNHLIKIRMVEKGITEFAMWWFQSPSGRQKVEEVASSTSGLHTLSVSKIEGLVIPIPSLEEIAEINERVNEAFSKITLLGSWCQTELARSAALRQSILKDAFAGKLVPQDPSDEPAAELLARIRASRTTTPTRKKARA